jgi:hypothetical protein
MRALASSPANTNVSSVNRPCGAFTRTLDQNPCNQDLANSFDFHFEVLSLSFQSLPCALWEGGAHIVRAATPC